MDIPVCKLSDVPEATSWQARMKETKNRPRVFVTYLHNLRSGDLVQRMFVTTVKDLHLTFGRLSKIDQTMLAEFLEVLFEWSKTQQLIVEFGDESNDRTLVTRTTVEPPRFKCVTYTLSPA